MTINQPLISLVVATRKRSHDLGCFLDSLSQTGHTGRTDLEVIIVDNNPQEKDEEVLSLCQKFNVRYIHEPLPGKSLAINTGIKNAYGEYIAFTDDDVIIKDDYCFDILAKNFSSNSKLGYISGNVIAAEITTEAQSIWEKKGGLSKGKDSKYWGQHDLHAYRFKPWPLYLFCAGANCMIPRRLFNEIGYFCELLGPGAMIGHGESLEIVDRIIRAGYDVKYESSSIIYHHHPSKESDIKKKLYMYGIGDTAIHAHIFITTYDWRSLWWAMGGHQLYTLRKFIKRFFNLYPLPSSYIIYSFMGSAIGAILYIYRRLKTLY